MPRGLDNLKHIVVLMMENRSFDHMLGDLKKDGYRAAKHGSAAKARHTVFRFAGRFQS
jgi:phospholipase C